jgi:large subunit ribosomal protein L30
MFRVTLKRSAIKATKSQQDTVRGLGLGKIDSSRVLKDTPEVRGMIDKVRHLVHVEEVAE